MFEGTSDPIDHERQGVLFYLYSSDLAALRGQLLAAGIDAGEIEDGSQVREKRCGSHGPRWLRSDDRAPRKATLASANPSQGSCAGNPTIVCNLGSLNAGASATVTIVVTASKPGWMTDHGWVSSSPPGNWQHHRAVSIYVQPSARTWTQKLSVRPEPIDPGQQVTYTATVSNSGNGAAGSVAFQDLLPGKATLVSANASQGSCSGTPVILCSLGSLNAGASATITIVATANVPGKMTDHAWVSANPPGNWQHQRSVDVYVRDVSPALALRLSGSPGSVNAGQQVTYTATVTNTGNGTDANAGFQDLLHNNTTLVTVTTSQGTCTGNPTIACNLGPLDRGASATITIVVTANQPGKISDRAWVSTSPPGHWEHQHSVDTQVHPAPPTTTVTTSATTTTTRWPTLGTSTLFVPNGGVLYSSAGRPCEVIAIGARMRCRPRSNARRSAVDVETLDHGEHGRDEPLPLDVRLGPKGAGTGWRREAAAHRGRGVVAFSIGVEQEHRPPRAVIE